MKNYLISISKRLISILIFIVFIFTCSVPIQNNNNKITNDDTQNLDFINNNRVSIYNPEKQYIIESVHSDKVIDVAEISVDNKANIH